MKDEVLGASIGILCLTAIMVAALLKGIDSTLLAGVSGTIGTLVGYMFGKGVKE